MNDYLFLHQDKAYSTSGLVENGPVSQTMVNEHNRKIEATQIEYLKTGPIKFQLYVGHAPMEAYPNSDPNNRGYDLAGNPVPQIVDIGEDFYTIQTFLGTRLAWAWIGERKYIGFDRHSYRRAVTARIYGTLYHGWYMESSGDYCRLKRAKKQDTKYGATRYYAEVSK